jgi:hypothetical protein
MSEMKLKLAVFVAIVNVFILGYHVLISEFDMPTTATLLLIQPAIILAYFAWRKWRKQD